MSETKQRQSNDTIGDRVTKRNIGKEQQVKVIIQFYRITSLVVRYVYSNYIEVRYVYTSLAVHYCETSKHLNSTPWLQTWPNIQKWPTL